MKKLTKVTLMFDDDSEVSMESAKEINMNIKTEFIELPPSGKTLCLEFLPASTTVTIDFVLSKISINGDKQLAEFVKLASTAKPSISAPEYTPAR